MRYSNTCAFAIGIRRERLCLHECEVCVRVCVCVCVRMVVWESLCLFTKSP